MKDMYIVGYKVKGIKNLDQMVSLSFFKKTIALPIDTVGYNIKGIYGMNGSGKSGIITSVDVLRNLLIDDDYLNNPMVQKNLDAIVNKKTKELYIEVEFLVEMGKEAFLYRYMIKLKKNISGKYVIGTERLTYKMATSRKTEYDCLIETVDGDIVEINSGNRDSLKDLFIKKTANLLETATISSLFFEKIFISGEVSKESKVGFSFVSLLTLFMFGNRIHVYMDKSDDHMEYFLSNIFKSYEESEYDDSYLESIMKSAAKMDRNRLNVFSIGYNYIPKDTYDDYKQKVERLESFIQIFKADLTGIDIERKDNDEEYVCSLNMVYGSYSINAEFESTGIKKLIKLFAFIDEMAQGGIVFIDELDSNLHDVYLCALLEYLAEYGEGQLCFTTHNVGPMDILKKYNKSIDFLSIDHKIYPWKTNGNYSPSKLYRNGMIEGSPFNVESIDFIGVFDSMWEDE